MRVSVVVAGGLVAGTCDLLYAIGFWAWRGVPATRVLQSVASGLLGDAAFAGGATVATLGFALHFGIALIFAFAFAGAARRLAWLVHRPVLMGALYGFGIYWVMNLVVLPLSAFPRQVTFPPVALITGLLVHMLLVGVPIALATRRALVPAPPDGANDVRRA